MPICRDGVRAFRAAADTWVWHRVAPHRLTACPVHLRPTAAHQCPPLARRVRPATSPLASPVEVRRTVARTWLALLLFWMMRRRAYAHLPPSIPWMSPPFCQ